MLPPIPPEYSTQLAILVGLFFAFGAALGTLLGFLAGILSERKARRDGYSS